jgi:hypothetical protein
MGYIAVKPGDRLDLYKGKNTSATRMPSENKEIQKKRHRGSKSRQVPSEPKRTGVIPVDGKLSVSAFDDTLYSSSSAGQQTDVS